MSRAAPSGFNYREDHASLKLVHCAPDSVITQMMRSAISCDAEYRMSASGKIICVPGLPCITR